MNCNPNSGLRPQDFCKLINNEKCPYTVEERMCNKGWTCPYFEKILRKWKVRINEKTDLKAMVY